MKCQFCHYPLKFSHTENNKEVEVYDCLNCPMLIFYSFRNKSTEPFKITFMLNRNGKTYLWTNDKTKGYSYVTDVAVRTSPTDNPLVLKLPKIVEVTPETVYQKLSFYMVFI